MHYPRNAWYVASCEGELTVAAPRSVVVLDEPIVLWRTDERVIAMMDRCVHRSAALSLGRCEGRTLRCMYHGIVYDTEGQVVEIPGQESIPEKARVKTYPVVERYGWIWLWMGNAEDCDPTLIPGLPGGLDIKDFDIVGNALEYSAEARLINDNLLDFSHLSYVHKNSFRIGDEWASSPMSVEAIENGVHFERWIENAATPGYLQDLGATADRWLSYDYTIPGVLMMFSGVWPAGIGRSVNASQQDYRSSIADALYYQINVQAVTPVSARAARYYYLVGPHLAFRNVLSAEAIGAVNTTAFIEDKAVIEAQQDLLDRDPNFKAMPTVHDRGVTLYNRMIDRRVVDEASHEAA